MRRVLMVGSPGAGKTMLAQGLSQRLGLPVIHLDVHYYRPGWQPSEADDWRERAAILAEAPDWIMDGNFSDTYDIRMPRADSLVWLDLPRVICLTRVLVRAMRDRGRARVDLPHGCSEQLDAELMRFVWDFPVKGRRQVLDAVARFGAHLDVFRLRRHRDIEEFLKGVGST